MRAAGVKPLTKESRLFGTSVKRTEIITISGIVREADLNDKRFEVGGIEENTVTGLRCIYGPKVADRIASM